MWCICIHPLLSVKGKLADILFSIVHINIQNMSEEFAITIVQSFPVGGYEAWSKGFWSDTSRMTFADDTRTIAGQASDTQGVAILSEVDLVEFSKC